MFDNYPCAMIVITQIAMALCMYIPWPSRWNIPAHLTLGLCLPFFVLPSLYSPLLQGQSRSIIHLLLQILFTGLLFYAIGIILGGRLPMSAYQCLFARRHVVDDPFRFSIIIRRAFLLTPMFIVIIAGCFAVMGFIPAFADDPLQAKYFRGTYGEAYRPYAFIYRSAYGGLLAVAPVVMASTTYIPSLPGILISLASALLLIGSLRRSPLGDLVLLGIAPAILSRPKGGTKYLLLVFAACSAAGLLYIPGQVLSGESSLKYLLTWDQLTRTFASQAPDILDSLRFLTGFEEQRAWTYGRTFIGQFVPFHYEWNPAMYSLAIYMHGHGGTSVVVSSGGLRIPMAVWGYSAFSFTGVVLLSGITGLLHGSLLATLRWTSEGLNGMKMFIMVLSFIGGTSVIWVPYNMGLNDLPAMLIWLALVKVPPIPITSRLHL